VKWTKIIEQLVTNLNNICLNEITEKISDLKHNLTESNSSAEIPAKLDNLVHDFSDLSNTEFSIFALKLLYFFRNNLLYCFFSA
jgi:hypothetical protein